MYISFLVIVLVHYIGLNRYKVYFSPDWSGGEVGGRGGGVEEGRGEGGGGEGH